jgi:hypothetical protein
VTIADNSVWVAPSSVVIAGEATFTANGVAVAGVGTDFVVDLGAGDWIESGGHVGKVSVITNATSLTLTSGWLGPSSVNPAAFRRIRPNNPAVANTVGVWLTYLDRATITGNQIFAFLTATEKTATIDNLRYSTITGNSFFTNDETIAAPITLGTISISTLSNNNFLGIASNTSFAAGMASGNLFRTASTFNGHAITTTQVWGFDGGVFWRQGTAAPGVGETWAQGDYVRNTTPAGATPTVQWVCTVGGNPATFVALVAN